MHFTHLIAKTVVAVAVVSASVAMAVPAIAQTDYTHETKEQKDARMKWFREAKFGMFIHWGVYSVPAGEYQGDKGLGEWFAEHTKMPMHQYEKFAMQFNPKKFDARAWVTVAKEAGVRYIVITSKHHDGFGMYPSKLTDWCLKSTPFKRDPLKELAEACKEQGIVFCLYHSIMDWHHPRYAPRRAYNDTAKGVPNMDEYRTFLKGQLTELLTNYGPIGLVWFDGGWEESWTRHQEYSRDLYNHCRNLQPTIIVNDRVANGYGDYGTPEQTIPGVASANPWESCMTMNDHWGYNRTTITGSQPSSWSGISSTAIRRAATIFSMWDRRQKARYRRLRLNG